MNAGEPQTVTMVSGIWRRIELEAESSFMREFNLTENLFRLILNHQGVRRKIESFFQPV